MDSQKQKTANEDVAKTIPYDDDHDLLSITPLNTPVVGDPNPTMDLPVVTNPGRGPVLNTISDHSPAMQSSGSFPKLQKRSNKYKPFPVNCQIQSSISPTFGPKLSSVPLFLTLQFPDYLEVFDLSIFTIHDAIVKCCGEVRNVYEQSRSSMAIEAFTANLARLEQSKQCNITKKEIKTCRTNTFLISKKLQA